MSTDSCAGNGPTTQIHCTQLNKSVFSVSESVETYDSANTGWVGAVESVVVCFVHRFSYVIIWTSMWKCITVLSPVQTKDPNLQRNILATSLFFLSLSYITLNCVIGDVVSITFPSKCENMVVLPRNSSACRSHPKVSMFVGMFVAAYITQTCPTRPTLLPHYSLAADWSEPGSEQSEFSRCAMNLDWT